jgi:Family of unknown function (DUF6193)
METHLAKTVDPALYPDVAAAGGLGGAITDELKRLDSESLFSITERDGPAYARVERGRRFSQIMLAEQYRAFHIDLWDRGLPYGSGWAQELSDAAALVTAFVGRGGSAEDVARDFSWFEMRISTADHETGWLVNRHWAALLHNANPDISGLHELIDAASRNESLRQLNPYVSMNRLCFSRTTGIPYTRDCPFAYPVAEGGLRGPVASFRVCRRDFDDAEVTVGEGSLDDVIRLLADNLPRECDPAVDGTADDL